jgi:hypothetical protein
VRLAPTGKRRLVMAHTSSGHSGPRRRTPQPGSRLMLVMSALTMIGENLDHP